MSATAICIPLCSVHGLTGRIHRYRSGYNRGHLHVLPSNNCFIISKDPVKVISSSLLVFVAAATMMAGKITATYIYGVKITWKEPNAEMSTYKSGREKRPLQQSWSKDTDRYIQAEEKVLQKDRKFSLRQIQAQTKGRVPRRAQSTGPISWQRDHWIWNIQPLDNGASWRVLRGPNRAGGVLDDSHFVSVAVSCI